jgi:Holliday junction resolvase RusA-like endonuclease
MTALLIEQAVFKATAWGCTFTVYGEPAPGGSKIPGMAKNGKMFVRDDNPRTREWKDRVGQVAGELMRNRELYPGPLKLTVVFYRPRPKGHYTSKGGLTRSAPKHPITKPDLTKLIRPLEDALRGIVFKDDAQICQTHAGKLYGEPARVEVKVQVLT